MKKWNLVYFISHVYTHGINVGVILFSEGVDQTSQLFNGILWIQGLTYGIGVDHLPARSQFKVHLDVAGSTSVFGEVQELGARHILVKSNLQHSRGDVFEFV